MSLQRSAGARSPGHRRRAAAWAAVAVSVAIVSPPLHSEPAQPGGISGHVTLTSRMRGTPISTNAYGARGVTHQATPTAPEMRSVVLYLKGVAFAGALPVSRAQIRQQDESFAPRVVAITRGSTVDFPNFDPYFHNVFSLSGAAAFDLGRYPDGQSRSRQFAKAGIVKVYCHIHSQMSATIVVLDHPYFTTPEVDGQFTIANVPPGEYTLVGWHERIGEQASRVSVEAGRITTADVSLPVGEAR